MAGEFLASDFLETDFLVSDDVYTFGNKDEIVVTLPRFVGYRN